MRFCHFYIFPVLVLAGLCALPARGVDFTWTGGGADSNWTTAENWEIEEKYKSTYKNKYPQSSSDVAVIADNSTAVITLPQSLTIYGFKFGTDCSLSITGVPTADGNPELYLYFGYYGSYAGIASLTLDRAKINFNSIQTWTPKAGSTFTLKNGSSITVNYFNMTAMDSISLSGGSSMSVSRFTFNGASRTVTLDDSSFIVREHALLGNSNPGGGRFVFKGAHPLFKVNGAFRSYNNNAGMTEKLRFDFEVPEGGFAETPIQSYGKNANAFGTGLDGKLMEDQASVPDGYMQFTVTNTSPAVVKGASLDFCAYMNPFGAIRSKASNGDETTAAMRFANGAPGTSATSDAEANMIWLKVGSGDPTAEASHSSALIDHENVFAKKTSVARHVITATGWLPAVATDGSAANLELWVGESNDASAMTRVSSAVVGHVGATAVDFAAPENVGEKTFYFQFRLFDVAGAATNHAASSVVFSATTEDTTVYTWKDVDGDWSGDWHDADHWATDFETKTGVPESAHATARFPRGHAIAVTVDDDATVGKLDLSDYNPNDTADAIRLTLKGRDGDAYGTNKTLAVTTLSLNAANGRLKLDRAKMTVANEVTLGARRTFELANGSFFSVGKLNSNAGGTFYVGGGSTASLGAMQQENVGTTLVIDDATLYIYGYSNYPWLQLAVPNVSTSGGTVIFRGAQPVLRFAAGKCIRFVANGAYTQVLTFEVPVGGYAEAPIRTDSGTVDFPQYYGTNFLKFEIDPESPCYTQVTTFDTPLVSWPGSKQVLSTGKNIFGTLGDGGYFCYGTSAADPYGWTDVSGFSGTAKSIGAHVVSVAHNDLMSVADDVGGVVVGCVPGYDATSQSAVASGGKISFSAPATYEVGGTRYTCAGYTLTEIEKTASGSVTNVSAQTGHAFAYTVANREISVVWHFTKDYRIDAAAVNDANATVTVTAGSQYVSETTSATLTASTASGDMEFQYWYGDLPYTNRYANPLTLAAGKAPTVRAFFGRKASSAGTLRAESGNNTTKDWFDAATWTDGVVPGTNDTAIVRWTEASSYNNYRFAVTAACFFAVKDLVISNAQVMVNSSRRDNTAGAITLATDIHANAPDQTRTEPVGCDIWGDLVIDCYQTDSSKYSGWSRSINGGRLYVGGDYQQGGSQIEVMGDLTVADGELVVQAGHPFDLNWIDATKKGDGPDKYLPFTYTNEFFRGRNFVRVRGMTTVKTPARTDTSDTTAYNVIQPVNDLRTGAAVWFDLKDLEVQSRGAFSCYYGGYAKFNESGLSSKVWNSGIYQYAMCPGGHGGGDNKSGSSYGGYGGAEDLSYPVQKPTTHVATYGFANAPYYPGSPNVGSAGMCCMGAGSIRIDCRDFILDGSLVANGMAGSGNKGASSGGGIWVLAKTFTPGSECCVQAMGGLSTGGNAGGGGGRVAIGENLTDEQVESIYLSADHTAAEISISSLADKLGARFSVAGGTGTTLCSDGYDGTGVYIVNIGGKRTMTVSALPSNIGEPEPSYGPHVFEEGDVLSLVGPADAYVTDDHRSMRTCDGYVIADTNGSVLAESTARKGSYTVADDCTLTWKMTTLVHELTVGRTVGGKVVTNAIGAAGSVWQEDGSTVSLTAVPSSGFAFAGWYGELPTNLQHGADLSFAHTEGRSFSALFVSAAAEAVSWTGLGDGRSWEDAANWSTAAIPGPNSDVTIPSGSKVVADFCVPIEVKSLVLEKNATLVVAPNGSYSTAEQPRIAENAKETDWQRIALSVSGDVTVNGTLTVGGLYSLAQFDLAVGGSLVFADGAKGNFYAAYSAPARFLENPSARYGTNQTDMVEAAANATGGRVTVGNAMEVATNALVSVWCDYYSGASVRFAVGSLFVAEGGKIDADGKGWDYAVYSSVLYALSPTLTGSNTGGYQGGTHAGVGGYGVAHHIPSPYVYGWAYAPFLPGGPGYNTESSPKTSTRAHGGGVVRIHAERVIRCYGTISALGGISIAPYAGYAAAGGSIFLSGERIRTSDTTVLCADGHDSSGSCGAGGGGRIMIAQRLRESDLVSLEATGTCRHTERNPQKITDLMSAETTKPIPGTFTANGGTATGHTEELRRNGEDGTAYFVAGSGNGLIVIIE